ncbi:hypothetical protein GALMADRAFT_125796 [Galerina marginata CBS 339.88]|uniref:VOC domain-containing protein n=1 Tax=Galerina marginata (strain CBS 339.88) TaxID=685588 RepID=A0A067SPV1_GALM3|nr:hypothetical protein GALMADRAFT_125796 [Galerina marginata CBS 339.88]
MPLHHLGINVRDIKEARDFYLAALKPLGYGVMMSFAEGEVLGLGPGCNPDFWLAGPSQAAAGGTEKVSAIPENEESANEETQKPRTKTGPLHLAFTAKDREQVRKFYDAAIAAGGKCNGPPGVRPEYLATYYAAFILDLEGRNIEAVCIKPAFLAEQWGMLGWTTASTTVAVVISGIAKWAGWY